MSETPIQIPPSMTEVSLNRRRRRTAGPGEGAGPGDTTPSPDPGHTTPATTVEQPPRTERAHSAGSRAEVSGTEGSGTGVSGTGVSGTEGSGTGVSGGGGARPGRRGRARSATDGPAGRRDRRQRDLDDARDQITLYLPNDLISAANDRCVAERTTHGAMVIHALIAADSELEQLVSAHSPATAATGRWIDQSAAAVDHSGNKGPWTCALLVRNRRQIDELADDLGVSRSHLVTVALRHYLSTAAAA